MASIKDLKKRISTVKNTQQTTRAMKMVSAAKLRRAQEAILAQRPYANRLNSLMKKVALLAPEALAKSPYLAQKGGQVEAVANRVLLVVVSSDRGLCGGFNSAVIKFAQRQYKALVASGSDVSFAFLGKRGHDFFKGRPGTKTHAFYTAFSGKVTPLKARGLSESVVSDFLEGRFDRVLFVYNEFKNAISQRVVQETLLPLDEGLTDASGGQVHAWATDAILKPSGQELLDRLLEGHFSTQVYRIMLESQASEHGARMSAMENATKNAGEMIRKLTLQYNKQRQANVTRELLEIIAGSESQKQTG